MRRPRTARRHRQRPRRFGWSDGICPPATTSGDKQALTTSGDKQALTSLKKPRLNREKRVFHAPESVADNFWTVIGGAQDSNQPFLEILEEIGYPHYNKIKEVVALDPYASKTKDATCFPVFKVLDVDANQNLIEWLKTTEGTEAITKKEKWQYLAATGDEVTTTFLHFATLCFIDVPEEENLTVPWRGIGQGCEMQDAKFTCCLVTRPDFLKNLKRYSRTAAGWIKHIAKDNGMDYHPWK